MDIPDANIFKHKLYNDNTLDNDLALIKLPWPAPMPTRNANPSQQRVNFETFLNCKIICCFSVMINEVNMPAASMRRTNLTNKVATISGWGLTSTSEQ